MAFYVSNVSNVPELNLSFHCVILCWKVLFHLEITMVNLKQRHIPDSRCGLLPADYGMILILFIAATVRIYRFGSVPGGVNQDGAMAAVDAAALAKYGTDRLGMFMPVHFTAWGYGQMSVLMSYLMVPFIKLFGLSTVTMRLPSLLVSLMGLVFLYLFSKKAFGSAPALIIAGFCAICPWHFMQSRWALDCNLFPHFLVAGLYFILLGAGGRRYCYYISMLFFALSMYCYGVSIYTVPFFLLVACIALLLMKKMRLRDMFICAGIYLLVSWPFIACMVINALGLETIETPFFTIPYFPNTIRQSDILFFSDDIPARLAANIKALLSIIFQRYDGYIFNDLPRFATLYVISIPFMLFGLICCFVSLKAEDNTGYILTLVFLFTAILCGLVTSSVNVNRINIIFYPLIILTGLGIYKFAALLRPAAIPVALIYALSFGMFISTYFTSFADSVKYNFLYDFGQAVSAAGEYDADRYYITADSQDIGRGYVSEILTLFWMDIDAEEYQSPEFGEKYTFKRICNVDTADRDAVYVVTENDLQYFNLNDYTVAQYDRYYLLAPADKNS